MGERDHPQALPPVQTLGPLVWGEQGERQTDVILSAVLPSRSRSSSCNAVLFQSTGRPRPR